MAILRKALADDADHPKYIETLARRGYRLIAPVEWQQNSTAAQDTLDRSPNANQIEARWVSENREHQNIGGQAAVVAACVCDFGRRRLHDLATLSATPRGRSEKDHARRTAFENLTDDRVRNILRTV